MTCHRTFKTRVLSVFVLFIAVLAMVIACPAQTHRGASGQTYLETSAASVPLQASRSAEALVPESRPAKAQRTLGKSRHEGESATNSMSASPFIFLSFPTTLYDLVQNSPSWVGAADVNGDGKPDLVVIGNSTAYGGGGLVGVLLGNGDGTFQPVTNYDAGGHDAGSGALADLNGDGRPDLIIAGLCVDYPFCRTAGIGVLLGNGDGTFQPAVTYAAGGVDTQSVAAADVNGDGKLDLLAANCNFNCPGNGSVGILLGNGDGTFRPAVSYEVDGFSPVSVATGDVNGDNKPDLLVGGICISKTCGGLVSVSLGNGDGTFQPAVTYDSGEKFRSSVQAADVNGDGVPDLVIANSDSPVGVMFGNGDGTFQAVVHYNVNGISAAVWDVNGDGKSDFLVGSEAGAFGGLNLLLGNGDGTFGSTVTYPGGCSGSGAIVDVNGDGRPDLAVTDYNTVISGVGVLLNNTGAPSTTTSLVSSANPATVNQTVTYKATVQPHSGGTVKGTVLFQEWSSYAGFPLGEVPLEANRAALSLAYSYPGSHAITATYSGDLNNASGSISDILTESVRGTSKTTVTTSGSPSLPGQPVTFTAKVTSQYGSIPDHDQVTFYDGATSIGTGATTSGVALFTTSSLTPGTHFITATYVGDSAFSPSSGTVRQVVSHYTTSTSLSSSLNPSIYGQSVTWTAKVTTSGPLGPTGKVDFTWGSNIGSGILNASGIVTLTRSNLNAYTYPLTAVYRGDAYNATSTSSILNQVVTQTTSSAKLTSSPNPSSFGQVVTFTATITSPTVMPTGPVTFAMGKTVLGTAQLSGGKAKFTISTLAVGSTKVTATYYGNSNIGQSSASVTQTVLQ